MEGRVRVDATKSPAAPIRFTIVTAVYNVARYLPDFIASIEGQDFDLDQVQVVAVDDGSTDESADILRQWQRDRPEMVTVLQQENNGQGSARNLGLGATSGEWVTFTDPDDTLAPDYFRRVDTFLRDHPGTEMVATARILFEEAQNRYRNGHPLRAMFTEDKLVDLIRFPNYFHGSAPAAFFKRAVIDQHHLRFDDRIQPNFEDGHFCCSYVLRCDRPLIAFVGSAHYHYRKRADQSSTLQTGQAKPSRYTHVPRYGYLDVLRQGAARFGRAPEWSQTFIMYELSWYFQGEETMASAQTAAMGETGRELISILREISGELDDDVIEHFVARKGFKQAWREILRYSLRGIAWHTPYVVMQKYDPGRQAMRVVYRYSGEAPTEEFFDRGLPRAPLAGKHRGMWYFGQPLLTERIVWIPVTGTIRIRLDGRTVELRTSTPGPLRTSMRRAQLLNTFGLLPARRVRTASVRTRIERWQQSLQDNFVRRLARSRIVRHLFRRAWVVMDRVDTADENGERLYEYLRHNRRDINAWFVLKQGTKDWARMHRQGSRRLVAYGSLRWKLLMLNAQHVVSSHCYTPVYRPKEIVRLAPPRYKFTFLQHGVIKDDISRWLNQKDFDLMITSTPAEHESIVRDLSPYRLTTYDVARAGLPRFDRLHRLAQEADTRERNLILLAPTWRDWLNLPLRPGEHTRRIRDDFVDTEYAHHWLGLLADAELKSLAADGFRIGFLPHPNIQQILPSLSLPDWVEPLTFNDDVQRLFATCIALVTDYSSMAFNAAYANRAVIYFQFDADQVEKGGHIGRKGYFDYHTDGFGPVVSTVEEAAAQVTKIARAGGHTDQEYPQRIAATFDMRDGRSCARTVEAIEALTPC